MSEFNEPWKFNGVFYGDNGGRYREILDSFGNEIIGEIASVNDDEAKRIALCVNFCAGIKTEWLEEKLSRGKTLANIVNGV